MPLRELSTTLLTAAHRPVATGHLLCTGQVGDGLIAAASRSEGVLLLGSPQYGKFANETQFLTHLKAPSDFRARVSQEQQLPSDLRFLVLLTDGVADDFLPAKSQLPRLFEHLPGILGLGHVAAPQQLMALLRYSKRGSFDDRTAVVIGLCGDPGVCS